MTMHGAFWRFPRTFAAANTKGIRVRSAYMKVIGDFCRWNDRLVFGCDDSAKSEFLNKRKVKGGIDSVGQSQSNLWFASPETPDKLGGENEYSTLRALGSDVAACSTVYYWPKENRRLSEGNKPGILHVKCAVADAEWLFLSSANLTQQAFTVNMELGMLVRGGTMPGRVEEQFRRLIQDGQLRPV
jgi:phosphatidylserine/phosphatidylglycerophosphate/cardiolipin synthase-like enzyme